METGPHPDNDNNKRNEGKNMKRLSGSIFVYRQNFLAYYKKICRRINKEKQTDEEINRSEKNNRRFQNWGVIINGIMVIIFMGSVLYQGCQTRKSLNIADSALIETKRADTIANKSLQFVIHNNEENKTIDRLKNRAYLDFIAFPMIIFESGKKISYQIKIRNSGFTPAFNIDAIGKAKIGYEGVTENEIESVSNIKKSSGINSFKAAGANFSINLYTDVILSKRDSIKIREGQELFYIYGCIFYNDYFGMSHWQRFYLSYTPKDGYMTECIKYNDTDKN